MNVKYEEPARARNFIGALSESANVNANSSQDTSYIQWRLKFSSDRIGEKSPCIESRAELDGEEDVVEDAVDGIEERRDEAAADEEQDEKGEHAHAVVELGELVGKKVAEDVAAVERRQRDEVEYEKQQVDEDDEVEKERDGEECRKTIGSNAGNVLGDGDGGGD